MAFLGLALFFFWPARHAKPITDSEGTREPSSERESESIAEAVPAPESLAPAPAPSTTTAPLTQAALMERLRKLKDSDPLAAVELAREGNLRFSDSREAPERASILIHALAQLDRGSEARGEAEHMVNHYPDTQWVREIEQFTGAHRHRNLRLNDAGDPEFFDP